MTQKFLYLVDYWVPFPASEYSGLIAVVGANDNEVHDILLNWRNDYRNDYLRDYDSLIMQNVVKAQRFALANDQTSRVVQSFTV